VQTHPRIEASRISVRLPLLAMPAAIASMAILWIAAVDRRLWVIQWLAFGLAFALAALGPQITRRISAAFPVRAVLLLALCAIAAPLLSSATGPERWVSLGPLRLYIAPLVLPVFLIACASGIARRGVFERLALAAMVAAAALLAAQPDASQALALLAALLIMMLASRSWSLVSIIALLLAVVTTAWACTRPDPLQPVPHVEGVFALAFAHSFLAGILITVGALIWVVGLHWCSSPVRPWPSAVAGYYAVLFACSIAGLTPAPLIGYGAGPVLGYGLMLAVAAWSDRGM
jgi:cell division protein FtsW (lipid II flippase)